MNTATRPTEGRKNIFELLNQPQSVQYLPSLRTILRELEEKTSLQQVAIQDISKIIRNDQSLSVRIIRLANSGYFSLGQPIMDLDEAILYLGLNNVRTVVFTSRCIETTAALNSSVFSWSQFWKHSAAVAAIAKLLATNLRKDYAPLAAESYYLMGLLHDIGKVVLALLAPKEFEQVLLAAKSGSTSLNTLEMERFGVDHANLGAWYLQKQGVPATLFEAVRMHHNWKLDSSRLRHAYLLYTADRLARYLKVGQSGNEEVVEEHPCMNATWLEYVKRFWEPMEDPAQGFKLIEEELARLPDLVQSITA